MQFARLLSTLLFCGAVAACSNTTTTTTWANPNRNQMTFFRPVVLFVSHDAAIRRFAEDRMAKELPGAKQAYLVIPEDKLQNTDYVKQIMKETRTDGVIIMRVIGIEQRLPAARYGVPVAAFAVSNPNELLITRPANLWTYWGTAWDRIYDPGYYYGDQLITVQSSVYSAPDEELLWAGVSQTLNPTSLKDLIDDVVDESMDKMKDEGLRWGCISRCN